MAGSQARGPAIGTFPQPRGDIVQYDLGRNHGRRQDDDGGSRQSAGDRLTLLAQSPTYAGPRTDAEAEIIRSWVLHGNQTIPEEHRG